jgi:hypothetical protein
MKIHIADWRKAGGLFTEFQLPYSHGEEFEGTETDMLRIAEECFRKGLNVMLARVHSGTGTRKDPRVVEGYLIAVDTFRFQQR